MTTPERKKELEERERERLERLTLIEIELDGELIYATDDMNDAVGYVRDYIFRKPFWETVSLIVKCYKTPHRNPDFLHRFDPDIEPSQEKNLMFKDDDRKYICVRCKRETEICGFCSKCYPQVYGLEDKEPIKIKVDDLIYNEGFLRIVENDIEYTAQVRDSIMKNGMKNPIIIDEKNRILIGHHRYFIAKELDWEYIDAIINPIHFGYGYFYEGKGFDLFVIRLDGTLMGSIIEQEDIYPIMKDFEVLEMGQTLVVECFLNVGSDIRLRNVFIPERGHIVDQTWKDWWINKFGKDPR